MSLHTNNLTERLSRLGIEADSISTEELTSATAALSCFPMYMVANLHGWTKDTQFQIPLVDIPGFEAIREAFVIGRQEKKFDITPEHRKALGTMLSNAKPADLVIYEYALETLALFLDSASSGLVEEVKTAIARMVIAVAKAAGEGLLGTGEKISRYEVACINDIADHLKLRDSAAAAAILKEIEV